MKEKRGLPPSDFRSPSRAWSALSFRTSLDLRPLTIHRIRDIEVISSQLRTHHETRCPGRLLLHTGCKINLIFWEHAQRLGLGRSRISERRLLGIGDEGADTISLDEVGARWWVPFYNRARYKTAVSYIVKDNSNEVVIDIRTVLESRVFELGPTLACSLSTQITQNPFGTA